MIPGPLQASCKHVITSPWGNVWLYPRVVWTFSSRTKDGTLTIDVVFLSSFPWCSPRVWLLEVFVVLNAFPCKERLFESIPCAALEHSRMQTVDNHISHPAAPHDVLSPIHSLCNVLMLVFVFFLCSLYLPCFLLLTSILIWAVLIGVDQPILFLCSF